MRRDYRKNKLFNRRTVILNGIRTFLSAILVTRLGYLQLGKKHKEFSTRSDKNRIKTIIQPAQRGVIFDRNKKPLVLNRKNYRLLVYLENKSNIKNTIKKLVEILNFDKKEEEKLFKRIANSKRKTIVSLIDNLSWSDLSKVEVNAYKLPELSIESAPVRYYNFPLETAHLIGYVSLPSEREIEKENQKLFLHPNFRIGKSGIEKSFDKYLRGKFGIKYSEVNAFGLPLRDISQIPSIDGKDLTLTINLELQKFIYEKISQLTASVVVMDVNTGEILALNSSPSFDINNFVEGFSEEYWQELTSNEGKPLNNKPLSANYPPGSVFKLMVALAALENGWNPRKKVNCSGKHRFGKRTFHCWKEGGHGSLDMDDAIKHSCNIYFFNLAQELGIDKITQMAKKFGYGQAFDIDLQEVNPAPLPNNDWKRKVFKKSWVGGDTLNAAIGQGFMLASPIQIAVATSRIANGGIAISPHLVKNANSYDQFEQLKNTPLIDTKYLEYVKNGMNKVVNEKGGTAYYSRIRDKHFQMAGKTGTSQVISKREKDMSEAELKKNQNHAIFTAFAPVKKPRYAISVVVEHGGGGAKTAAPLAKEILQEVRKLSS